MSILICTVREITYHHMREVQSKLVSYPNVPYKMARARTVNQVLGLWAMMQYPPPSNHVGDIFAFNFGGHK